MSPLTRFEAIKPFYVMSVLERAQELERQGARIVHLEIGEPDFDAPACVREAACRAMEAGHTHYTHSLGLPELRQAISEDYAARYGVSVDPERILVTSGTSPAMLLCFSVLCGAGDNVLIPDPGYACYPNFIRFVCAEPRLVPVREEDGFQYQVPAVRAVMDERSRAVVINSPGNPTGTIMPSDTMAALAELAEQGLPIVSDEIYHGLTYVGRERSILEFTDKAVVLNGFSKLYAMTGWRLGYLISPERYMPALRKLAQNLFICAGSVAQWAGLAALREAAADVERMRATYDERRRYMLGRLRAMGLTVAVEPTSAFYILANAKRFTSDSLAFAFDVLEKAHVGVTPGMDFGPGGEGYIRFSYANSLENIREGMDRLERYLSDLGR
ncbi:MAG: pyridoxal phosphate-dependent aminotransferase [Desulfocurvibacter africanus]